MPRMCQPEDTFCENTTPNTTAPSSTPTPTTSSSSTSTNSTTPPTTRKSSLICHYMGIPSKSTNFCVFSFFSAFYRGHYSRLDNEKKKCFDAVHHLVANFCIKLNYFFLSL